MCMNKPKVDEKWVGKRLVSTDLNNYLKSSGFN